MSNVFVNTTTIQETIKSLDSGEIIKHEMKEQEKNPRCL